MKKVLNGVRFRSNQTQKCLFQQNFEYELVEISIKGNGILFFAVKQKCRWMAKIISHEIIYKSLLNLVEPEKWKPKEIKMPKI